jgi:predicted transcriptional regulator
VRTRKSFKLAAQSETSVDERTSAHIQEEAVSEDRSIERGEVLALTAEIVSSHVSNNSTGRENLPELIQSVFDKLAALASDEPAPTELTPAVPVKKSVTDDYIVCLEDGKKLKMLKRHLGTSTNPPLSEGSWRTDQGPGCR